MKFLGIQLRKIVDRRERETVLGSLHDELAGKTVSEWMDELRGPVELPAPVGYCNDSALKRK